MHPPLFKPHPDCEDLVKALVSCHEQNPYAKFWGACNDPKMLMDQVSPSVRQSGSQAVSAGSQAVSHHAARQGTRVHGAASQDGGTSFFACQCSVEYLCTSLSSTFPLTRLSHLIASLHPATPPNTMPLNAVSLAAGAAAVLSGGEEPQAAA